MYIMSSPETNNSRTMTIPEAHAVVSEAGEMLLGRPEDHDPEQTQIVAGHISQMFDRLDVLRDESRTTPQTEIPAIGLDTLLGGVDEVLGAKTKEMDVIGTGNPFMDSRPDTEALERVRMSVEAAYNGIDRRMN